MGIIGDLFGAGKMFLPQARDLVAACLIFASLSLAQPRQHMLQNPAVLQVIKSARVMKKAACTMTSCLRRYAVMRAAFGADRPWLTSPPSWKRRDEQLSGPQHVKQTRHTRLWAFLTPKFEIVCNV